MPIVYISSSFAALVENRNPFSIRNKRLVFSSSAKLPNAGWFSIWDDRSTSGSFLSSPSKYTQTWPTPSDNGNTLTGVTIAAELNFLFKTSTSKSLQKLHEKVLIFIEVLSNDSLVFNIRIAIRFLIRTGLYLLELQLTISDNFQVVVAYSCLKFWNKA